MNILQLTASNVKRLSAVEITPDGSVVIAGRNGAGKSSVLDSIAWAIAGAATHPTEPIRHGETQAEIRVDLGDLVVERRFSAKGTRLTVRARDGSKISRPQEVLDSLIGELSFDPLAFLAMRPADQAEAVQVASGVDNSDLDDEEMRVREARTENGREERRLRALVDSATVPEDAPEEEIDIANILQRMDVAQAHNAERTKAEASISRLEHELQSVRDQMEALLEKEGELCAVLGASQEGLEKLGAGIRTDTIREELQSAESRNAAWREAEKVRELEVELAAATKRADLFQGDLERIDAIRRERLAAADVPIEGLEVRDGHVRFRDVPLEQCSAAERMRISVAIGMAQNPKLRVMTVRDAALLDEDSMRSLLSIADQLDVQLWVERVDPDETTTVLIEDGAVVEGGGDE